MLLKRKDFSDFLKVSGKALARTVSSSYAWAMYCFRRLWRERIRMLAFSFEIPNVAGIELRMVGTLSPCRTVASLSSLPDADAKKMAYNCSLDSAPCSASSMIVKLMFEVSIL